MSDTPVGDRTDSTDCCAVEHGPRTDLASASYVRSVAAAVLGSACCTLPLLLVALGVGIASAMPFVQFAPLVGAAAMATLIYRDVRRLNGGVFSLGALSRARRGVVLSLATFAAAWLVMTWVVTPALGSALTSRAPGAAAAPAAARSTALALRLRIEGMYCPACVYTVQSVLERLDGVSDVAVTFGGATLAYDPAQISAEEIRRAATFYVYEAVIE